MEDHCVKTYGWLVVYLPLRKKKNISQLGLLYLYGQIKKDPNHQPDGMFLVILCYSDAFATLFDALCR